MHFIFLIIFASVTFYLAKKFHYFQLPDEKIYKLAGYKTILAYALVIAVLPLSKIVTPYIFDFASYLWENLVFHVLYLIAISLFITFFLKQNEKIAVLGKNFFGDRKIKDILMGVASFFVLIPLLSLIDFFLLKVFNYYGVEELTDQVAVQTIKNAAKISPFLLYSLMFVAVVLTPILEEIWFRGFLQNWLKQYLGRKGTIIVVAIFFSLIHYSSVQGLTNIVIFLKLVIVGLFLGFIFERQKSLLASIALHSFFNGVMAISLLTQLD